MELYEYVAKGKLERCDSQKTEGGGASLRGSGCKVNGAFDEILRQNRCSLKTGIF